MKKIEEIWHLIRHREALDGLPAHLAEHYGIRIDNLTPLDAGVYRIELHNGPKWVARMFPSVRPFQRAEGDAEILRFLEEHNFPAERLAHPESLSMHEGQAVLVTRYIESLPLSDSTEQTFHALGELLGRLHTLPKGGGRIARKGGAIHSFTLNEGGLRDEVAEAMMWLAEADIPADHKGLYDSLLDGVSQIDFGDDLPHALLHPDPVLKNVVATPSGEIVLIDWTGAGRGPRAHSLAFLLFSALTEGHWNPHSGLVEAVMKGYRKHVKLENEEFSAIAAALPLHILVGDCAAFCMGRTTFDEVAGGYAVISGLGVTIADKARQAVNA